MESKVMKTLGNFFRVDCTSYGEWLLSLSVGDIGEEDLVKLSTMMNELDPVVTTKGNWSSESLCKAKVFYNGDNNSQLPTHPLYKQVVGVQLCDNTRAYFNIGRK